MKIKKSELKRLIKEEIQKLNEATKHPRGPLRKSGSSDGWSNRETRSAFSMISAEESSYKKAMKMKNGKELKKFFSKIVAADAMLDSSWHAADDINLKKINWDEVYDAIQDEG